MKKLTAFLLSLTLLFTLTACGNPSAAQDDVTPPSSENTEQPSAQTPEPAPAPEDGQSGEKILVAYFSASNNTERVAQTIAYSLDADLFELIPADEYTNADLDYSDPDSRVSREHDDPGLQNVELVANTVSGWDEYGTVFIGYPIWWHAAAWPVNSFITGNDFTGKTVIPFCTSASSGLEDSGDKLEEMAETGNWLEGQRFSGSAPQSEVEDWVQTLGLSIPVMDEVQEQNTLVAYFSMPETTDPNNMTQEEDNSVVVIDGEVLGNTQYMAYVIQETLGADIFRIEPETPYPTDHDTLVDQARDEQNRDFRPAIKHSIDNIDSYDVIYLGYPNWWGDLPMILYSFLEAYDLSGKTIIPFNTHGGSGFSGTISTIADLQPNATVVQDGLTISRNHIQDAEQEIIDWVQGLS